MIPTLQNHSSLNKKKLSKLMRLRMIKFKHFMKLKNNEKFINKSLMIESHKEP